MKRERTFKEKLIIATWDMIVFIGVLMFALDVPYQICKFFDLKATFTLRVLTIAACIYLYGKSGDIKSRENNLIQ